jgi:hypothetical protein
MRRRRRLQGAAGAIVASAARTTRLGLGLGTLAPPPSLTMSRFDGRSASRGRAPCAQRVAALARHLVPPAAAVPSSAAEASPAAPDLRLLAHVLDGSDQATLSKMRALQQFENDPAWAPEALAPSGDGSADPARLLRRLRRLFEYLAQDGTSGQARAARLAVLPLVDPALHLMVMAHYGQFVGALEALGSPAARAELLPLALAGKVLGCFACAEADPNAPWAVAAAATIDAPPTAWGFSDVDVQATASWLPDTDQILLETSPSAVKWGIAGLSVSTHAVVIARLWLPAPAGSAEPLADCGLRGFLVRIRQPESGALLPGVSTGDCPTLETASPGAGLGWLRLSGVRVARSALLGRFSEVRQGGVWVSRDPVLMGELLGDGDGVEAGAGDGETPPEPTDPPEAAADDEGSSAEQAAEPVLPVAVGAEEVFGSSILQANGRCALLREAGEAHGALLYRAAATALVPPTQVGTAPRLICSTAACVGGARL